MQDKVKAVFKIGDTETSPDDFRDDNFHKVEHLIVEIMMNAMKERNQGQRLETALGWA